MPNNNDPKKVRLAVKSANLDQLHAEVAKSKILEAALDYMKRQPGFKPGDAAAFELEFGLKW